MRKLFIALALATPLLAETDDFAGSGALGAGWEFVRGTTAPTRSSGELVWTDDYEANAIRRTGSSYPDNQECTIDYKHPQDTSDQSEGGCCVRMSGDGQAGYCAHIYPADIDFAEINKLSATTLTPLDSGGGPCSADHTADTYETYRLVVSGTSLSIHRNGSQLTGCNGTDDDVASGKPGIFIQVGNLFPTVDNYSGTDASGGGGGPNVARGAINNGKGGLFFFFKPLK